MNAHSEYNGGASNLLCEDLTSKNARLRSEYESLLALDGESEFSPGISNSVLFLDAAAPPLDLSVENSYFQDMCAWERGCAKTIRSLVKPHFQQLNMSLATDAEIARSLQVLCESLREINQIVVCADHLPDRALYQILTKNLLNLEIKLIIDPAGKPKAPRQFWFCCFHAEDGFELPPSDFSIYLTYYATVEERVKWLEDHNYDSLPEMKTAQHERSYLGVKRLLLWD
jgi:hypothetical protein